MDNIANRDSEMEAGQLQNGGPAAHTLPASPRDHVPPSLGARFPVRRILANTVALAAAACLICYARGSVDFPSRGSAFRGRRAQLARSLVSVVFQFVALLAKRFYNRCANCL